MANGLIKRVWGGLVASERSVAALWSDLLLLGALVGLFYGVYEVAGRWHAHDGRSVQISLSPWMLPWYTFLSLCRGLLAYGFSLAFALAYGYWAAKDRRAERILIPLLDILQSIPVLGFMPGLVIAMVALFKNSNVGIELAAVLMIFTGQAWNMAFSFYRSLRSVPRELGEAADVFGYSRWQRLRQIELPTATVGLVWNSMMSMAGGWFFLTVSESFVLGDQDYRLPGIGSYMSEAAAQGSVSAQLWGIAAMVTMIVVLDQVLWRPLVVWSQRFRVEDNASQVAATSWLLDWLARSRLRGLMQRGIARMRTWLENSGMRRGAAQAAIRIRAPARFGTVVGFLPLIVLLAGMGWGGWKLVQLIRQVSLPDWGRIFGASGLTLLRVVAATAIGTLWTVPVGLAIGLSPRLSRICQPVIQVVASFPAPMLFPLTMAALDLAGIPLGLGSIVLMLLGTQWYVMFNVIAGASAIPADLREAFRAYRITGWQRFRQLYLPAIFPYLVTGWVTAMGGAWNASIVAEFVKVRDQVRSTTGIGAIISQAAEGKHLAVLAASVVVMAVIVVAINRLVWHRMQHLGETRFSFDK